MKNKEFFHSIYCINSPLHKFERARSTLKRTPTQSLGWLQLYNAARAK